MDYVKTIIAEFDGWKSADALRQEIVPKVHSCLDYAEKLSFRDSKPFFLFDKTEIVSKVGYDLVHFAIRLSENSIYSVSSYHERHPSLVELEIDINGSFNFSAWDNGLGIIKDKYNPGLSCSIRELEYMDRVIRKLGGTFGYESKGPGFGTTTWFDVPIDSIRLD